MFLALPDGFNGVLRRQTFKKRNCWGYTTGSHWETRAQHTLLKALGEYRLKPDFVEKYTTWSVIPGSLQEPDWWAGIPCVRWNARGWTRFYSRERSKVKVFSMLQTKCFFCGLTTRLEMSFQGLTCSQHEAMGHARQVSLGVKLTSVSMWLQSSSEWKTESKTPQILKSIGILFHEHSEHA